MGRNVKALQPGWPGCFCRSADLLVRTRVEGNPKCNATGHFGAPAVAVDGAAGNRNIGTQTSMTTANRITIFRILLIPFFVVEILYYLRTGNEIHRWLGIGAFAVAAVCDGVDGYVARHFNQRSELGAILDPLADKLLLVSAIVLLSFDHSPMLESVPLWLTGTIIGRDILLLAGLIVIQMTVGKVRVRPRILGKIATVLQMAAVIWILMKWPEHVIFPVTLAAAVCTGISGLLYVWDGTRQMSAHPTSSPTQVVPPKEKE
jgi:cardiolipin synthase (CMP-forming)